MSATVLGADESLVEAARGGDREAFGSLMDRHRGLLEALCRRSVSCPSLAEDAVHEAILQAMLNLDRLRRPELFGQWLAGIGLNICRRFIRERAREPWSWESLCGGRAITEPVDECASVEMAVEQADLAARIREAVNGLPAGQRAAVMMFYLSGLTQRETAELLGVEISAVKTRLHKARRTLRQKFWNEWKEDPLMTETAEGTTEMRIVGVFTEAASNEHPERHLVKLEAAGGKRLLIWIGWPEAMAIAGLLDKVPAPRPMTTIFTANLIDALGGKLREVRIERVTNGVFYAVALVEAAAGVQSVDARPSDAMSLALATDAPIRVADTLLEEIGIPAPENGAREDDQTKRVRLILDEGDPRLEPVA